jgi:hypothetical protein
MINRNLSRRLKRLEAHVMPAGEPHGDRCSIRLSRQGVTGSLLFESFEFGSQQMNFPHACASSRQSARYLRRLACVASEKADQDKQQHVEQRERNYFMPELVEYIGNDSQARQAVVPHAGFGLGFLSLRLPSKPTRRTGGRDVGGV